MVIEEGALEGVKILDLSRVLAGPLATMVLADLGADVVKVEHPEGGDDTRGWGPPFVDGASTYFQGLNRNKRSIALDLSDEGDLESVRRLCRDADVVVDNFRPGRMERWGLEFESLVQERPGIVTCSISGFGTEGDGADLAGYDFLVQAMSGLMSITGPIDGEPFKVGVALVDKITGLYAAVAILGALRHRDRTGEGQHIEVSLMGSALAGLMNVASGYLGTGVTPERHGNRHPSIAPYQTFNAADGHLVVAVGSESLWTALCNEIGLPDLVNDERFGSNDRRVANIDSLEQELNQVLRTGTVAEWVGRLRARGIPAGPINDVATAFATAERLGLGAIEEIQTDDGGAFRSVRSPMRMSATPPTVRRPPPELNQHGEEVLDAIASPDEDNKEDKP